MAKKNDRQSQGKAGYGMTFGSNLSFGAAEAYKLLRTNLNFSLPDVEGCKVLGITSTLRGEGKSTTAVNLAYTIAQTGQKVLLVEADLRLPTLSKRIGVKAAPGLSNLLAGQCNGNDALQKTNMAENLWVISAGDIPPNPAELLNSDQMAATIKFLSDYFSVIIVDLPPVSVVSDALIISKLLDGMVVVVRQNMCGRRELNDTIRQLKFTDCKILGFVMTDSRFHEKRYRRYKRYEDGDSYHSYGHDSHKQAARQKAPGRREKE